MTKRIDDIQQKQKKCRHKNIKKHIPDGGKQPLQPIVTDSLFPFFWGATPPLSSSTYKEKK